MAHALALLAQREYSRTELGRKLLLRVRAVTSGLRRGRNDPPTRDSALHEPAEPGAEAGQRVEATLDWLVAHCYLSEQRFVESRIRLRSERFGNLRIRHELAQHGLTLPAPAEAALIESEFERARAIWERRFGSGPSNSNEAAKQMRFLTGRGFSADVIRRVLRGARAGPASLDGAASA